MNLDFDVYKKNYVYIILFTLRYIVSSRDLRNKYESVQVTGPPGRGQLLLLHNIIISENIILIILWYRHIYIIRRCDYYYYLCAHEQ